MDNQNNLGSMDDEEYDNRLAEKKNAPVFYFLNILKLVLSFVPYVYVLVNSVGGIGVGMSTSKRVYGLEAVEQTVMPVTGMFTSIGVVAFFVPLCLIYQIYYVIRYRKEFKLKIAVGVMVILMVIGTLMVEPVSKEYRYSHAYVPNIVAEYLVEKYGQREALDMRILLLREYFDNEYTSREYRVYNPLTRTTIYLEYESARINGSEELTESVTDEQKNVFRDGEFVNLEGSN